MHLLILVCAARTGFAGVIRLAICRCSTCKRTSLTHDYDLQGIIHQSGTYTASSINSQFTCNKDLQSPLFLFPCHAIIILNILYHFLVKLFGKFVLISLFRKQELAVWHFIKISVYWLSVHKNQLFYPVPNSNLKLIISEDYSMFKNFNTLPCYPNY